MTSSYKDKEFQKDMLKTMKDAGWIKDEKKNV